MSPDPIIAEMMVDAFIDGAKVIDVCNAFGVAKATFYRWMTDDDEFAKRVTVARREFYFSEIEKTIDIADKEPDPKRARVRIWARHELAAKLDPDRYGARQKVEVKADVTSRTYAVAADASPQDAARAYQDFIKD